MSSEKIAVLFPGQGSQYVGMGKEFMEANAAAREIMAMAEKVSGLPLGKLCGDGPLEELTQARNLQPALTAACLLCWQALSDAGVKADFFAGHSLGEYAALCAAKVLSPEDTIKLVAARGRLMGKAGEDNPGGMCAVLGMSLPEVEEVLSQINRPEKISVGNYNSAQQIVLSGDKDILAQAAAACTEKGAKAIPLNVSVANHSPLMAGAVAEFEKVMGGVTFNTPEQPVYFNVTGALQQDPAAIKQIMADQIKSMVRWLDIINQLEEQGVTTFIEVGPKKVLTGLIKRILPRKSGHKCIQVDSPDTLDKCLKELGAV